MGLNTDLSSKEDKGTQSQCKNPHSEVAIFAVFSFYKKLPGMVPVRTAPTRNAGNLTATSLFTFGVWF